MQNIFSSIFKNKIKLFFAPIFDSEKRERGIVPLLLLAGAWKIILAVGTLGAMIWSADKVARFIEGDTKFFESLLAAAAAFLTDASQAWVEIASGALDFAIKNFLTANITGTATSLAATSLAGWALMRDLANMFIVLGFVVVGIAFTLRLESYGSKKVLISLIMVALLINFSPLICGIIIDTSNILVSFLLQSSNPSGMIMEFKDLSSNMITGVLASQPTSAQNVHEQLGISMTVLFINLMIIVSFFTYAVLIIARYVMLSIFFMFSPLAFACYVFPFTKKYAQMWWDNFLKWCFIGVIGFFFIWFAVKMLSFWQTQPGSYSIYHVLVIFVILMAGYKFTKASSAIGASVAIGLVAGAAGTARGKITGAAKKLGGQALQKMRGEKGELSKSVNSVVGRTMERIGLRQTGTTATANAKRVDEEAKTMANEYAAAKASGDAGTVSRIRNWAKNERGVRGAAAMKVVADAKDLHKAFDNGAGGINMAAAAARLKYAESVGAKDIIKDQEKLMPDLKGHNDVAINEEYGKMVGGAFVYPQNAAGRTAATREVVRKQRSGMSVSDMRNMPHPQITADFVDDSNYKTFARAALEYSTDQNNQAKTLIPELKDRAFTLLSVPGANAAARQTAYNALTPAQRTALLAALNPADQDKVRDYFRKVAVINR